MEQSKQQRFNQWAKRFAVGTLYDYDKFENRQFIKQLDEARPIYEAKNKQQQYEQRVSNH